MGGEPETAKLLALADRAEALGLDSLWVGDSLLAKPRHEPLALLAAIAGRTTKISLGTAVLLPVLRNPVLLAHQVATLDRLCQGRLILGIGSGSDQPAVRAEFEAAGVPFEKRGGRMLEGIRLCQALWSGEPVDWQGRWMVRGGVLGPTPHRPGGPPIWAGGAAPGVLKRTGRYFDGWFPSGPSEHGIWRDNWDAVRGHASAAGRDPDQIAGAAYLTLCIDEDAARANQRLTGFWNSITASLRNRFESRWDAMPATGPAPWRGYRVSSVPAPPIWRCASPANTNAIWKRRRRCARS